MNCSNQNMSRRAFMTKSADTSIRVCSALFMPTIFTACFTGKKDSAGNYYLSQKAALLRQFDDAFTPGKNILAASVDDTRAENIFEKVRTEYAAIIPTIPYIGGEENISTQHLVVASQCLAIYRTLKGKGLNVGEIGKVLYEMTETYINVQPKWALSLYGGFKYHWGRKDKIRDQAKMSQERQYPMDFVFTFIEGDGKKLDYGTDMIECGIIKFFHAQHAEELIPYICVLDFPISRAFDRGLVRTMTLTEGADKCDFRYKKGRMTQERVPPGFHNMSGSGQT